MMCASRQTQKTRNGDAFDKISNPLTLHKNGLQNALADDVELDEIALFLAAWRVSQGPSYALNSRHCLKRFGIGRRSFDGAIGKLKVRGWMMRTQPKTGRRKQFATDCIVIKQGGKERVGYTIYDTTDFAIFDGINSRSAKREAATALGLLIWLRSHAPNLAIATASISHRFAWTRKTAAKHVDWLIDHGLAIEVDAPDGLDKRPRYVAAVRSDAVKGIDDQSASKNVSVQNEATPSGNFGASHLHDHTSTNHAPELDLLNYVNTPEGDDSDSNRVKLPTWVYSLRAGDRYNFFYLAARLCDPIDDDEHLQKWIAADWNEQKIKMAVRKAARNRVNDELLTSEGLEGLRFCLALVDHLSQPVQPTFGDALAYALRVVSTKIGQRQGHWLNCWSLVALTIGNQIVDGTASISPAHSIKLALAESDTSGTVLVRNFWLHGDVNRDLRTLRDSFASTEALTSWTDGLFATYAERGWKISSVRQLDAALAELVRNRRGADSYRSNFGQ